MLITYRRAADTFAANKNDMELSQHLIYEIKDIISTSRESAMRAVDNTRVLMYWNIGRRIFEEEQQGKDRAEYGASLLESLSAALQPEYGSAFSTRNLSWYRQFYRKFPIVNALRSQFSWTHYRLLLPVENQDKTDFYLQEAAKNNWTARQLERQINSQLYERLLLSTDKTSVLAFANNDVMPLIETSQPLRQTCLKSRHLHRLAGLCIQHMSFYRTHF